jgi:hypothetical protein
MFVLKQLINGFLDGLEVSRSKPVLVGLDWFGSFDERDVVFNISSGGFAWR